MPTRHGAYIDDVGIIISIDHLQPYSMCTGVSPRRRVYGKGSAVCISGRRMKLGVPQLYKWCMQVHMYLHPYLALHYASGQDTGNLITIQVHHS